MSTEENKPLEFQIPDFEAGRLGGKPTPITDKARGRWYRQLSEDQAKIEDIWQHAERLEAVLHALGSGLTHMQCCGSCAEDGWDYCEEGKKAQAALDAYRALLPQTPPPV
jgi:hypothetical protein